MLEDKIVSVTIDGPAGVGKTTITKLLAQKLGWPSLETGALYRAMTVFCLLKHVDLQNESEIVKITKDLKIEVKYIDNIQNVFVDGKNFTPYLRKEEVDKNVALVAKVPEVRESVREVQRNIAQNQNVVVEGRDIGTVVLPNSVNKFYLTAAPEIRATRRFNQLNGKTPYATILDEIKERDYIDMTRKTSPLLPAKDAIIIDTSTNTPKEIVDMMISKIKLPQKQQGAEM